MTLEHRVNNGYLRGRSTVTDVKFGDLSTQNVNDVFLDYAVNGNWPRCLCYIRYANHD